MNTPIDITGVTLKTQRLILRPWRQDDLEDFYEYASVDGVGQMAGWAPHESREVSQKILDHFIEGKRTFAVEYNGKVIGSLGVEKYSEEKFPEFDDMSCRELGYVLSKDYWGMGLIPEAAKEVIRWLFEEVGLDVILCAHFVWNTQSARVQEKCGFVFYKDGEFTTKFGTVEKDKTNILTRAHWYAFQGKKYYEAYDERYRAIHEKGFGWSSSVPTPIVMDVIDRYGISKEAKLLDLGCGEGRDAKCVLDAGYDLTAADVSPEAVDYCKKLMPEHAASFRVMDCLNYAGDEKYDLIYSVAVIHMLVKDEDRAGFYAFIREHLNEKGFALICSMGDGGSEFQTDPEKAFDILPRRHPSGEVMVAATTCRMVSFATFEREIAKAGLEIIEKGLTECMPEFDSMLYAVVRRA